MLFLNNDDIQQVLTIEGVIQALEEGHAELARQELVARPRVDTYAETDTPGSFYRWGTMEGTSKALHRHAIRMKSDVVSWRQHGDGLVEDKYCVEPGLFCGLVFLFDTNTGEPLAIMNEGYLQHLRVGALAGLGAKYLAAENAASVGMLGAGGMARSHLMAFAAVRNIKVVKVFSPTKANRDLYAQEMSASLGVEVIPCDTAEEAVKGADILSTCTNSIVPTVFASMLEPGMHLTQVAGEFAPDVVSRIEVSVGGDPTSQVYSGVAIDDSQGFTTYLAGSRKALDEARRGASSRVRPRGSPEARVVPLVDLIAGSAVGRTSDSEISASGGVRPGGGKQGLQFVTTGSLAFDLATQAGLGHEVPTEWFLQDIRN